MFLMHILRWLIQDPQGKGVWAVLVGGVQAPGPFSIF